MTKEEQFEIPKLTFKDFIRYAFPITIMIVMWFLLHLVNYAITFQELLQGFIDFVTQVGAMFAIYLFSKLFIEWLIEKLSHSKTTPSKKAKTNSG